MAVKLVNSAAVVAAHHFNPSVTSQVWLIDNEIVLRDEFTAGGAVYTDMFVQVPTRDFHLLIIPDNCQFTPAHHVERPQELIVNRVGRLVEILPHTPYKGVGVNFMWHFTPENDTVNAVCRQLFYHAESPLHRLFDVNDARFGCYLSRDSLGFRLKLNVQPVMIAMPDGQQSHLIQFAFNYNFDLAGRENSVAEIQQALNRWNEAREESSQIVNTAIGGHQL